MCFICDIFVYMIVVHTCIGVCLSHVSVCVSEKRKKEMGMYGPILVYRDCVIYNL